MPFYLYQQYQKYVWPYVYDSRGKEIIILGDINCDDLLVEDKNTIIKNLRAFYGELPNQTIRKRTRVTNHSDTLIDHFNTPKFIIKLRVKNYWFQLS